MQNLSIFSNDFTKDFVVVVEASSFMGIVMLGFISGDVRNSFLFLVLWIRA